MSTRPRNSNESRPPSRSGKGERGLPQPRGTVHRLGGGLTWTGHAASHARHEGRACEDDSAAEPHEGGLRLRACPPRTVYRPQVQPTGTTGRAPAAITGEAPSDAKIAGFPAVRQRAGTGSDPRRGSTRKSFRLARHRWRLAQTARISRSTRPGGLRAPRHCYSRNSYGPRGPDARGRSLARSHPSRRSFAARRM